ncbi:hypothetical protein [Mucilaginibacter sp. SP1R1]|uniref:hypothetical protein n=1 Tax=Mucilaginibacter sp. SP1R1 TaxID=2723091 RepID=UPI001608376C|nr:hypothetical protein [Mucilaginibacter sp. SP1R1]MBB6149229.1 hypothetical protein [Mucilaginibacter sp. SP1R1]
MNNEKIIRPEWVPVAYQQVDAQSIKPNEDKNSLTPGKGIYKRERKKQSKFFK